MYEHACRQAELPTLNTWLNLELFYKDQEASQETIQLRLEIIRRHIVLRRAGVKPC